MSKASEANETKTDGRKGRSWSPKFSRTVKFYDENFDFKSVNIADEVVPATDLESAYKNLMADGMTVDEIVLAMNNVAKLRLIDKKTEAVLGPNAVSEVALNKFIEPYRAIGRIAKIKDKKEQTAAIIAKIKSDPELVEALRQAAIAETEETEGSEDTEETETK